MIEPGEIYFVSAGKNVATGCEIWPGRPGIVISSKQAIACSGTVNIIYLTSSERLKDFGVTIPESAFTASIKKYTTHTALWDKSTLWINPVWETIWGGSQIRFSKRSKRP